MATCWLPGPTPSTAGLIVEEDGVRVVGDFLFLPEQLAVFGRDSYDVHPGLALDDQ
jgi:hypothetical protein